MKEKMILAVAVWLILGSCTKNGDRTDLQLRLSLPGPVTKVALGAPDAGVFPIVWQAGDIVSLNGSCSNPMPAVLAGGADAAFSFTGFTGWAPYNLLYPGSSAGLVTLDGKTLPLYASGDRLDQVFMMHHLSCGIRLLLTGDLAVATLRLSAPGGEPVAGSFSPSFQTGTLSGVSTASALAVHYDTPVALSALPTCFYLFFAPGTFSEGLLLQAENAAGDVTRSWRIAGGRTLDRGKLYLLPETAFSSGDWADACPVTLEEMSEDNMGFEI